MGYVCGIVVVLAGWILADLFSILVSFLIEDFINMCQKRKRNRHEV